MASLVSVGHCYRRYHRKQRMRDLVLRTKHDIFEGVPNATPCQSEVDVTAELQQQPSQEQPQQPQPTSSVHTPLDSSPTSGSAALNVPLASPVDIDDSVTDSGAQLTVQVSIEGHQSD